MKKIITCSFFAFFAFFANTLVMGQNIIVKKTYYDAYHTKLKAEWQQTANGYTNGFYKEYYPSGKIYIDRIVKTEDVYPYWSIDLKMKIYDEAGNLKWSTLQNDKREFQGEQVSYVYNGPKLVLRSKAIFSSGVLQTYELFRKNGTKSIDLNTKSFYRSYDENGKIMDNVKIGQNGEFTGVLDQSGIMVEVLNGKIQKVYEKNPDPENGNWNVYRIGGDTLVSTAKIEGNKYFKKYYIDTVTVKLIKNPRIDVGFSQIQEGEIGLEFVDPIFINCPLSAKYCYDISFYNRGLQRYIKEEQRDITTDKLVYKDEDGKNIYFHPNGQIKRIVTEGDNWQDFDENGILINSNEIEKIKEQNRLLELEKERQIKLENERKMAVMEEKVNTIYDEFKKAFFDKKEIPMVKDMYGRPMYRDYYPQGENLYIKADKVYQDFTKKYKSEKNTEVKMNIGNDFLTFHSNLMALAQLTSKELKNLNKEIENANTIEEIKKVLGF